MNANSVFGSTSTYAAARTAFDGYAGMDGSKSPEDPLSARQVAIARREGALGFDDAALAAAQMSGCLAALARAPERLTGDARWRMAVCATVENLAEALMSACTSARIDFGAIARGEGGVK